MHFLRHPFVVLSLATAVFTVGLFYGVGMTMQTAEVLSEANAVLPVVTPQDTVPVSGSGTLAATEPEFTERERLLVSRLSARIAKRYGFVPSNTSILQAAEMQRRLLSRQFAVRYVDSETGEEVTSVPMGTEQFPRWMKIDITPSAMRIRIDTFAIAEDVVTTLPVELAPPRDSLLTGITTDEFGVTRAQVSGTATPGYVLDMQQTVQGIRRALLTGQTLVLSEAKNTPGAIANMSGEDFGSLTYLASGKSDFAGSGDGRKWNVRKGLHDRLNNVVLAPGESFSFNKTLGDFPRNGPWKEALGIFNGGELRPTIGGGLCQVATTVFRAAVLAGMPITERNSHSLFVQYYEKHGVGLDATIYVGKQDLNFTNDTGNYMLLQAYSDGDEAYVHVYGTPDGRTVEMAGPYFSSSGVALEGRKIRGNEIGWERTVKTATGEIVPDAFISTYKVIPRSIVTKYTQLHASAQ